MIWHNTYTEYTWRFDSHFEDWCLISFILLNGFLNKLYEILELNFAIHFVIYLNYLILLWMFMTQLWSADGQPGDWSNSDELWCHTCDMLNLSWWWFSTVIIRGNGYHPQAATCIYVNIYIYISKIMYIREIRPLSDWLYSHLYFASVTVPPFSINSVYPILGCVHTCLILGTMGWVFPFFTSLFFRDLSFFFSPGDGSLLIFWQCQPSTFLLLPCQGLLPSLYWFLLLLY